jgi:hypothetical protein
VGRFKTINNYIYKMFKLWKNWSAAIVPSGLVGTSLLRSGLRRHFSSFTRFRKHKQHDAVHCTALHTVHFSLHCTHRFSKVLQSRVKWLQQPPSSSSPASVYQPRTVLTELQQTLQIIILFGDFSHQYKKFSSARVNKNRTDFTMLVNAL